jgi:hypothetical protein
MTERHTCNRVRTRIKEPLMRSAPLDQNSLRFTVYRHRYINRSHYDCRSTGGSSGEAFDPGTSIGSSPQSSPAVEMQVVAYISCSKQQTRGDPHGGFQGIELMTVMPHLRPQRWSFQHSSFANSLPSRADLFRYFRICTKHSTISNPCPCSIESQLKLHIQD